MTSPVLHATREGQMVTTVYPIERFRSSNVECGGFQLGTLERVMADVIPGKIWLVRMQVDAGDHAVYPLLFPEVTWLQASERGLVRNFQKAFQKYIMEEGRYVESLRMLPDVNVEMDTFTMTLPPASDGFSYPELPIQLDYCWLQLEEQKLLGFVPASGVEACAATPEELVERLEESVKLEMARRKRLKSVHTLLPLLWMKRVEVTSVPVDTEYYTLAELKELQGQRKKRMLPEVAQKLLISTKAAFGREEELEQLARVGRSRYFRSVLLVGPNGTGKTALIQEWERVKHQHGLANTAIWEVSAARLLQKLTNQMGWQHNLSLLCEELQESGDILYVTNFSQLFEVGRYVGNEVSIGEYLRDYVARGKIVLLSECTEEELAHIELRYPGVLPAYQIVRIPEQEGDALHSVIHERAAQLADLHGLTLDRDAVEEAILLHRRFTPYSGFPGKPLRFLEALLLHKKDTANRIDRATCVKFFCEQTGMPAFLISPDRPMPLDACEQHFRSQIFGQDKAIRVLVDLLAAVKAGLSRQGKPIASLLFVGPTGVGKTEMAKVLAEYLFSDRERMVRFDMSEFSDLSNVLRLTGENMSQDGLLTSVVREQPFCVLLFDEIEKAHPSFYDLLLQVLGSGRLTDGRGRTADFCSTVIIMTSNIGADTLQRGRVGFVETTNLAEEMEVHFEKSVQRVFRPELFNRIDYVVPFAALHRSTVGHILQREMSKIRGREGVRFREVTLDIDDTMQAFLIEEGYHARYGARHLQRTLRDSLLSPLARELNRYGPSKPLNARAARVHVLTVVTVEESKEKSWAERAVAGTSHTLSTLTDNITTTRRETQRVEDGPVFVHLQSEIEILERTKKRDEKKFWENRPQGERYSRYLELHSTCVQLFEEILELETEAVTSLLTGELLDAELSQLYQECSERYRSIKTRLYTTMRPKENSCVIAIYGEHTNLYNVVELYQELAKARGFAVSTQAIWLEEGLKHWAEKMPLHTSTDRVVGMVLGLEGEGALLYWEDDDGLHIWEQTDTAYKYVVDVLPYRLSEYKVPTGIHRQQFFDNRKPRRIYADRRFQDFTYDLDGPIHQLQDALRYCLNQRFEKIVTERLIG